MQPEPEPEPVLTDAAADILNGDTPPSQVRYIIGDIHDVIMTLPDNSVNLIYTNPPFATTGAHWDKPLDWTSLFPQMDRVLSENGAVVLHCSIPFTYELISVRKPNYHYTWKKNNPTGFFQAKKQPLRNIEEVLVYYRKSHQYNPQMRGDEVVEYNRRRSYEGNYYGAQKPNKTTQKGRYPTTFLGAYKRVLQKNNPKSVPDALTEYFIKTYSSEGDTILDMTCCSRNNGDISLRLKRDYIGVDLSDEYLTDITVS